MTPGHFAAFDPCPGNGRRGSPLAGRGLVSPVNRPALVRHRESRTPLTTRIHLGPLARRSPVVFHRAGFGLADIPT